MNITQVTNATTSSSLTNAQTSTQATTSTSAVSQPMKKVDVRLQAQLDTTSAQLSSFGKLKSSVSDAQLAARALSGLTSTSSTASVKAAASQFMASFNAAMTTAKTTAAVPGGALAESSSAGRVNSDLRRTMTTSTATIDSLKKIGFKQLADGTLTLDPVKFDAAQKADPAAVRATLSKIGQRVDQTATQELATGGSVSGSMASLSKRSTTLKTQQNAMLTLQQSMVTAQSTSNSRYVGYGLAAYQSNY